MAGPSFICPGAQKSGTTWLNENLRRHPQFLMPPQKELDYLAEYPRSREKYRARLPEVMDRLASQENTQEREQWWQLFTSDWSLDNYPRLFERSGDRFSGDVSPGYSRLSAAEIARAARIVPQAKIVLLLRDPVDRAWSQARHAISRGACNVLAGAERQAAMEDFAVSKFCFRHGDYVRFLTNWQAAFGIDRVYVAYYDDLVERPSAMLNGILDFLGADPFPVEREAELNRVINEGEEAICPPELRQELEARYAPMLAQLAGMLPAKGRPGWLLRGSWQGPGRRVYHNAGLRRQ